jgi:hypothetical protein
MTAVFERKREVFLSKTAVFERTCEVFLSKTAVFERTCEVYRSKPEVFDTKTSIDDTPRRPLSRSTPGFPQIVPAR